MRTSTWRKYSSMSVTYVLVFTMSPSVAPAAAGAADSLEIIFARPVALLDRGSRIAGGLALEPSARERNRRSGEDQTLSLAADRRMPEGPSRMGAERHGDLRQRDAADLVAVGVDRGDE